MESYMRINKPDQAKESYGFISTKEVISLAESKGWAVSGIKKTRERDNAGIRKHLITLIHPGHLPIKRLHDNHEVRPELHLLNSHDGSTAFRLFLGFTRIACLNGLLAGQGLSNLRVIHNNNAIKDLDHKIDYALNSFGGQYEKIESMINTQLNSEQIDSFYKKIIDYRFENMRDVVPISMTIKPKRLSDMGTDIFTVMNVGQESLIRGGLIYHKNNKFMRTRPISSINQSIKANQFVWSEALNLLGGQ